MNPIQFFLAGRAKVRGLAVALVLGLLGAASPVLLPAQDAESYRSAVEEAKGLLGRPDGAAYEKRVGVALQRLPLAEALRDCMTRHRGKTPDMVNVVIVVSIDGAVRDALHPPNDPVSGCVAVWLNAQNNLPAPPRDAWMVHVQVKLRP